MNKFLIFVGVAFLSSSFAANIPPEPKWRLQSFLDMVVAQPDQLLKDADAYFKTEHLKEASEDPKFVHEWQDRLAIVRSLSFFFDPAQHHINHHQRSNARRLIEKAMIEDPALVVRDGAVEALRMIFRMRPYETKQWQRILEKAFADKKNIVGREGLFIRETILTTMREGSLHPSKRMDRIARRDRNPEVQRLLGLWDTRAFSKVPKALRK